MPTVELSEVTIHYKEHGEGPPCLGIMGFALDQRFWAAQIPAVTKTHRFITFDNRGVGRSTGEQISDVAHMVDDSIALLDHLEIDKTVVFGVSMGGTIAQQLALAHPERVEALILGITWARPLEFMRRQDALALQLAEHVGSEGLIDASLVRMFTPRFFEMGEEMVDRMVKSFFTAGGPGLPDTEILLAQLDALGKHDVQSELHKISVPTLVFGGKMDVMVPGFASEEIAAAIPGAELTMFDTGHGCMVEEMEAVNERISRFLATLV
jgi:pimeloyl-ACP methyl ester carboxylesterase